MHRYIFSCNHEILCLLQDRFAFDRATPRYDANQDWKLTDASEEGGYTTLEFERKFETCDNEDIALNFVRRITGRICAHVPNNTVSYMKSLANVFYYRGTPSI